MKEKLRMKYQRAVNRVMKNVMFYAEISYVVGSADKNTVQVARQITVMWKKRGTKSVIQILKICVGQILMKLALWRG
uniref:Candidate secreted effector n=1 Tax=Meloidogyne incognita TaxID=6306 RepID=A0A914L9P2_MELIC